MISKDVLMLKFTDFPGLVFLFFLCRVFEPKLPSELLAPCLSLRLSRGTPA